MTPLPLDRIDASGSPLAIPAGGDTAALLDGEAVHRELRPDLPVDYAGFMARMATDGARLTQLVDKGEVRALAVWRVFQTSYCGYRLEVDDLVTGEAGRSSGYGATLLTWLEQEGRRRGADIVTLNSNTQRKDAHRFYLRQRYIIHAFHFSKAL